MPAAIRRRWFQFSLRALLVVTALTAILVVCITHTLQWTVARSVSPAVIRVSPDRSLRLQYGDVLLDANYRNLKQSHVTRIKSPIFLQAAAQRPELRRLPRVQRHRNDLAGWMQKYLIVDAAESELIKLSFADGSASDRVAIVNAVKEAYLDELINADRRERLRQRDELEKQHRMLRAEFRLRTLLAETLGEVNLVSDAFDSSRDLEPRANELQALRSQLLKWGGNDGRPRVYSDKDAAVR